MEKDTKHGLNRRKFIISSVQAVGLSMIGGLVWGAYVSEDKSSPIVLRPPGALKEEDFVKKCIKCGLCVEACKHRPNNPNPGTATLALGTPGGHKPKKSTPHIYPDKVPIGTPYFVPREVPCYMCQNIPCTVACPTGALEPNKVTSIKNGRKVLDINKAKMGLAVIDMESCIAFWGIQCDACYRACPVIDKALTIEYMKNERTGKHAYLVPVVHSKHCTGCGMCEYACVTEKPSIFVLPIHLAKGKAGSHYVKGWEKKVDVKLKPQTFHKTKKSEKSPEEYLNTEDLFNE